VPIELIKNLMTIRNCTIPLRFKNFSLLCLNFPFRNSNKAMCQKSTFTDSALTTSIPASFTAHEHLGGFMHMHAAQTLMAAAD